MFIFALFSHLIFSTASMQQAENNRDMAAIVAIVSPTFAVGWFAWRRYQALESRLDKIENSLVRTEAKISHETALLTQSSLVLERSQCRLEAAIDKLHDRL